MYYSLHIGTSQVTVCANSPCSSLSDLEVLRGVFFFSPSLCVLCVCLSPFLFFTADPWPTSAVLNISVRRLPSHLTRDALSFFVSQSGGSGTADPTKAWRGEPVGTRENVWNTHKHTRMYCVLQVVGSDSSTEVYAYTRTVYTWRVMQRAFPQRYTSRRAEHRSRTRWPLMASIKVWWCDLSACRSDTSVGESRSRSAGMLYSRPLTFSLAFSLPYLTTPEVL